MSAQSIGDDILAAWDILDIKVVWRQLRHPPLLTSVQLGLCEDIRERVIICPDSKRMPLQPVAELVAKGPFEGEKLQTVGWVLGLCTSQGLARKSNRTCLAPSLRDLREYGAQSIQ